MQDCRPCHIADVPVMVVEVVPASSPVRWQLDSFITCLRGLEEGLRIAMLLM